LLQCCKLLINRFDYYIGINKRKIKLKFKLLAISILLF